MKNELKDLIRKSERIAADERGSTASFSESLDRLMRAKKISRSELALELGLSERTVSKIRNDDDYITDKQIVIGICVALGLVPAEAKALFEKSPYRLRMSNGQDVAYYNVLCTCGSYELSEINEYLQECGYIPLGGYCKNYKNF